MPIARIGDDETAFTAPGLKPIFPTNCSGIRPARDPDVRVVLLRAVNVIRKSVIDRDMVKLCGRLIVLRRPGFCPVGGDAGAAVVCIRNAQRILRINPKAVMISVSCRQERKIFAAVHGAEESGVQKINRVR